MYKWHFYHFTQLPDGRVTGGLLCNVRQVGNKSDVPANLIGVHSVDDRCCKICQKRVRLFQFPLEEAEAQRQMQSDRLAEIEAAYEKLRGILDRCVPGGGMPSAEGEIRFMTVWINEVRR